MATYASLPDDLDAPSVTYAIENPIDAFAKIPALRGMSGLAAVLEFAGVEAGVEFTPGLDVRAIGESAEFKVSIPVGTAPGMNGVGGEQRLELAYSPSAAAAGEGGWSLAVEQTLFDLGTSLSEEIAFKAKAAGLSADDIGDVLTILTREGRPAEGQPSDLEDAVERIFSGVDQADFKVLMNSSIDNAHDAAATALAAKIVGGATAGGELVTPVPGADSAVGFTIGSAIGGTIEAIALSTETSVENGVSTSITHMSGSERIDIGGVERSLGDALILGHNGGSALEIALSPNNLLSQAVNAMDVKSVEDTFPVQGRLLGLRTLEDYREIAKFAVNPTYNAGDATIAGYVNRRQADLGTSVWDLAEATMRAETVAAPRFDPPVGIHLQQPIEPMNPDVNLARTINGVLVNANEMPVPERFVENAVGTSAFEYSQWIVTPGSVGVATRALGDYTSRLRNEGRTAELDAVLDKIWEGGARELRLNLGIPELGARVEALRDDANAPAMTPEQVRMATAFIEDTDPRVIVREYTTIDRAAPLNPPREGAKQEVEVRVQSGELVYDAVARELRDEGLETTNDLRRVRAAPNGTDTPASTKADERQTPPLSAETMDADAFLRSAGPATPPSVAQASTLSDPESEALGSSLHALVTRLAGPDAAAPLAEALRTGDTAALAAVHPQHGAALAEAVRGVVASGASQEAVLAGIEATEAGRTAPAGDAPTAGAPEQTAEAAREVDDRSPVLA